MAWHDLKTDLALIQAVPTTLIDCVVGVTTHSRFVSASWCCFAIAVFSVLTASQLCDIKLHQEIYDNCAQRRKTPPNVSAQLIQNSFLI
jgi:hypothetical protein